MANTDQDPKAHLTNTSEEIDVRETWDEEDLQDLAKFSLSHSENPHEPTNKTSEAG